MNKRAYWVRYSFQVGFCLSLIIGQSAYANGPEISFAGFASVVYAKTLTDSSDPDPEKNEDGTYKKTPGEGTAGVLGRISDEGEYRDFNKLGLRMNADLDNNLSFTAQMIAEGSKDYDPEFDWVFATYYLTPDLSITAGKYRVPVFMYSSYLDTSYAYQWIAPPISVYNEAQTPFKSMEGLKLSYVADMGGDWSSELLVFGGKSKDDFKVQGLDTQLELEDSVGVAWTVDWNWLAMRAFYLKATTSADITTNPELSYALYGDAQGDDIDFGAIFAAPSVDDVDPDVVPYEDTAEGLVEAAGAIEVVEILGTLLLGEQVELQDDLLWENDDGEFYGIGASVDIGVFFAVTELTRIEVDSNFAVPVLNSFYLMVGGRPIPQVALSLTYGLDKDEAVEDTWKQFDQYKIQDPQGDAEAAYNDLVISVQGGVRDNVKNFQNYEIETLTFSARWDIHSQVALKFEHLIQRSEENDSGIVAKPQAILIGMDLIF